MIGINSLRFENYNIIIIVPVNILYPPRPPSHPLIYVLNPNNSLRQFVDEIVQKKKKNYISMGNVHALPIFEHFACV